jgi:hypothetical protein
MWSRDPTYADSPELSLSSTAQLHRTSYDHRMNGGKSDNRMKRTKLSAYINQIHVLCPSIKVILGTTSTGILPYRPL